MFKAIKKYIHKAKEEIDREYSINSEQISSKDPDPKSLPRIWTGVDLDGTLAFLDRGSSYGEIGQPVPAMMELVRKMIGNGIRIKIFTARAEDPDQIPIIRKWLRDNGLPDLEITNIKDYNMYRLYDDRCIQVERNTGRLILDDK